MCLNYDIHLHQGGFPPYVHFDRCFFTCGIRGTDDTLWWTGVKREKTQVVPEKSPAAKSFFAHEKEDIEEIEKDSKRKHLLSFLIQHIFGGGECWICMNKNPLLNTCCKK